MYMNELNKEQVIDVLFNTHKLWPRLAHTYDHKRKLMLFLGRTILQISGHHLKEKKQKKIRSLKCDYLKG